MRLAWSVAHIRGRHGTTPMASDIPHRSFVATAARVRDGVENTMGVGDRG